MMPFNLKSGEEEAQQLNTGSVFWNLITQDTDGAFWADDISEKEDASQLQNVPESPFLAQNRAELAAVPELDWLTENTNYNVRPNGNYVEVISPAPSSASTFSYFSEHEDGRSTASTSSDFKVPLVELGVGEKELEKLSVKELNRLLKSKGLTKEESNTIKYRRRTLKNRGYAQNCRIKRITQKKTLEESNWELMDQINSLNADLEASRRERDLYKRKYDNLLALVMSKRGKKPS